MPIRIQRKRTKGWKIPEGAVYVGRPSYFGNPYSVNLCGLEAALKGYRDLVDGIFDPRVFSHLDDARFRAVYLIHELWLKGHWEFRNNVMHLRGKDLVCWCPLSQRCHADILLEVANAL